MAMTANGMSSKIIAQLGIVDRGNNVFNSQAILALCRGIIEEIQTNSELIPITSDSGTAGAGIITGKVA